MSVKQLFLGAAAALLLVVAGIRLAGHFGSDPYLDRQPVTEKYLLCASCAAQSPVTQKELMQLYSPDGPVNDDGEPLLACPGCGDETAVLIVESPYE